MNQMIPFKILVYNSLVLFCFSTKESKAQNLSQAKYSNFNHSSLDFGDIKNLKSLKDFSSFHGDLDHSFSCPQGPNSTNLKLPFTQKISQTKSYLKVHSGNDPP